MSSTTSRATNGATSCPSSAADGPRLSRGSTTTPEAPCSSAARDVMARRRRGRRERSSARRARGDAPSCRTTRAATPSRANSCTAVTTAARSRMPAGGSSSWAAATPAAQLLAEISQVAETTWVTLRPPRFLPDDVDGRVLFDVATTRRRALDAGERDPGGVAGLGDVVMVESVRRARDRGVLEAEAMFERITASGIEWGDGSRQDADVILWCTGFRPDLPHLAPSGCAARARIRRPRHPCDRRAAAPPRRLRRLDRPGVGDPHRRRPHRPRGRARDRDRSGQARRTAR